MNGNEPIPIVFSGGMNNVDTPLTLFLKKQGETERLVNADTSLQGRLKILRPLAIVNKTAQSSSIHTIYHAGSAILIGTGNYLKYLTIYGSLTTLLSSLSSAKLSISHAGAWAFMGNGTDNKAAYLSSHTGTDWGQAPPTAAPTVATGAAGNPDGEYSCYYRYKITLPDGSILRTALSPVATVDTTGGLIIEWSGLVHATFTGCTCQIELFRWLTGFAATQRVTTLSSGTTTYSDDISDATLQDEDDSNYYEFAETGYYGTPDNINMAIYHPGADRVFAVVDNDIYWSEAGGGAYYHIFIYDETADEYTNVNSVFLSGENITGLVILDEQLYVASQRTWRRLRGRTPSDWAWEDTAAVKGPICEKVIAKTPWGALYPGNDGCMWVFNGYQSSKILETFKFDTLPDTNSHATFDGRYYRLFYGDTTYPELIIDFFNFPERSPIVVQSTRNYTCSFYYPGSNEFYVGDSSGYVRTGEDSDTEVTLSFKTSETPADQLIKTGDFANVLVQANTQGDNLIITPYEDGVEQDALTAFTSTSLVREPVPLKFNSYRSLAFLVSITTSEDIEIREPWMLQKGDDG